MRPVGPPGSRDRPRSIAAVARRLTPPLPSRIASAVSACATRLTLTRRLFLGPFLGHLSVPPLASAAMPGVLAPRRFRYQTPRTRQAATISGDCHPAAARDDGIFHTAASMDVLTPVRRPAGRRGQFRGERRPRSWCRPDLSQPFRRRCERWSVLALSSPHRCRPRSSRHRFVMRPGRSWSSQRVGLQDSREAAAREHRGRPRAGLRRRGRLPFRRGPVAIAR